MLVRRRNECLSVFTDVHFIYRIFDLFMRSLAKVVDYRLSSIFTPHDKTNRRQLAGYEKRDRRISQVFRRIPLMCT